MIALCLFAGRIFSQNVKPLYTLKITVKDSITGTFLEDATVTLTKHSHAHLTNQKGEAIFDTLRAGHYHFACTYIGYHSYESTLELPGQQRVTVLLCPENYHLHETIIEGNGNKLTPTYSVQATTILNQSQIEKMRGQNLGELLKNVNGVTTLNTGPRHCKTCIERLA
jgi:iron complex outermembrane receptor protein